MANTIRAAKNTFLGGLVMDLAPDTTPNEVLTSALNATLVTFNGNEMLLQNDMGNGRVETARLPEGYIPVGTCEFGDIIYIVSYNPLTNKSQIGCFPSPERNISSEEIGSTGLTLSSTDFQEIKDGSPTGELKASSVKKIIYNNKMNPGDKYIIYDTNNLIHSQKYLTDLGNTQHAYGRFPKLYRIHVIAIEDSGKINFLDSTVRWYDKTIEVDGESSRVDYFMIPNELDSNGTADIDSYRNLLSSGYSVFQSKISGKLGLLIELEKINGFSCTYNVYTKDGESANNISYKDCKVYWNINWNTENFNINPAHIVLTKSKWINKDLGVTGGTWFSWRYNETENQAIPDIKNDMDNLPTAFGEGNYWYTDITRQYDPTDTNITYDNFITKDSYEKKLETFITNVKSVESRPDNPYVNVELIKLNIARNDTDGYIGLPNEGNYYINLASMKRDDKIYKAYTEDLNNSDMYNEIYPTAITDDIVNNYFNTSISKYFSEFSIPVKQVLNDIEYTPNITNLIYNYEITPAMDYGLLREYSIEGYIDFSKIGTGSIDLTYWKYYNTENTSTLSIGFDAYVEENKGIAEVVLEFYDNQGIAAAYHIRNKESYSGTFTEFIPLNGAASSPNLTSTDADGEPIYHLGTETTKFAENVIYMTNKLNDNPEKKPAPLYYKNGEAYEDLSFLNKHDAINDLYINDAGTIYSNALYLVKIIVKYCQKDALGNLDTSINTEFKTYYRWFWTNTMYNQYYSNINDFDTLPFLLNLDVKAVYGPSKNYHYKSVPYKSPSLKEKTTNSSELYLNSAATVQVVSSDTENDKDKNNTLYYLQAGLSNTYNTFNLRGDVNDSENRGIYDAMSIDIFTDCDQYVENVVEDPNIVHAGQSNYSEWVGIKPIVAENTDKTKIGSSLKEVLDKTNFPVDSFYDEGGKDIWEDADGYKDQINNFQVTNFSSEQSEQSVPPTYDGEQLYIAYDNTVKSLQGKLYITKTLGNIYNVDNAGTFEADIIHFSKYYYTNIEENLTVPCLVPLLRNPSDLETYGLGIGTDYIPYVKYLFTFQMYDDSDGTESHLYINKYSYAAAHNSSPLHAGAWEDNWDDSENHSVFGYDDGYFFRDKKEDWISFKTKGFFLWGLSVHYSDNGYSPLCNFDPRNCPAGRDEVRNYREKIGGKWEDLYGKGEINYYATTDVNLLMGKNRLFSWNDTGTTRRIAAVGFNPGGDKLEHYFNTMFLVENIENSGQEVQFKSPYKEKYPAYIGQYIATILCGIYLYSKDENLPVRKTTDIVHMDNNYTIYTKDIVYMAKITLSGNHNSLISLHDIHFDDYITRVKTNSRVQDNQINDSNVTLTIQGCVKNNPIQYKLEYLIPKYDDLAFEGSITAMLLKADGTPVHAQSANFDKYKLYWLDENDTILTLSNAFSAECIEEMSGETGTLLATKYKEEQGTRVRMNFPDIYNMFKWEDDKLAFVNTDRAPNEVNRFSIHGQDEDDFVIRDMRKDEILVPLGNMMRPENIPI